MQQHKGYKQGFVNLETRRGYFQTLMSHGVKAEGSPVPHWYSTEEMAWSEYNKRLSSMCESVGAKHIYWRQEPIVEHEVGEGYSIYSRVFVSAEAVEEDMSKQQEPYVVTMGDLLTQAETWGPSKGQSGWRANKGYNPDNKSGFRATGHRVLLSPDEVEEVTASGIVLAKKTVNAEKQTAVVATVLEIGLDAWTDKSADFCQVGDRVLVGTYTGKFHESPVDGKEYRFVTDLDIISPIND